METSQGKPARRRDMSIASVVIVVAQIIASKTVTRDLDLFKDEFQRSQMDREEFFVRKTELSALISKLDHLNDQMIIMGEEIRSLKSTLEVSEAGEIGCKNEGMTWARLDQ